MKTKRNIPKKNALPHARRRRRLYALLIAYMTLVFYLGCEGFYFPSASGSLELKLEQNLDGAKTLVPSLDMMPARYDITGSGPSGASFSRQITGTANATINGLAAGSWNITVKAFNSADTQIGQGSTTVIIVSRTTATASVTVTPLSGNGSLSITLTWPSGYLANPTVEASLKPAEGGTAYTPSVLPSPLSSSPATLSWTAVPAGSYVLSIQLKDGSSLIAGRNESVRILKDQTTSGSYTWTGGATIAITSALASPLQVSINGSANSTVTLEAGSTLNLSATVAGNPPGLSYAWYINGVKQTSTTNSLTVGSGWTAGQFYKVDASAVTQNAAQAGSASIGIKSIEGVKAQWARTVSAGSGDSKFNSVAVDSSGNVYAAGYQYGSETYTYGPGVSAAGTGKYNVVLVKYY